MPPKLSILELFILTLLDRGMKSKYELQRRGGVSLGSSTPALLRMQAEKLVLQETAGVEGERKRHQIKLSKQGRHFARTAWKAFLMEAPDLDLDSILRLIDISAGYGATAFELADFLARWQRAPVGYPTGSNHRTFGIAKDAERVAFNPDTERG